MSVINKDVEGCHPRVGIERNYTNRKKKHEVRASSASLRDGILGFGFCQLSLCVSRHPLILPQSSSNMLHHVAVVVARDVRGGIGYRNALPWPRLRQDVAHFFRLTTTVRTLEMRNAVIMGRATWESLPATHRPLPHRLNVVVSSTLTAEDVGGGALIARSLPEAIDAATSRPDIESVFIVGGARLYCEALELPCVTHAYVTEIQHVFDADTLLRPSVFEEFGFEAVARSADVVDEEGPQRIAYCFQTLRRKRHLDAPPVAAAATGADVHDELQYLALTRRILDSGSVRVDRTGVGTRSVFGAQMRFSLRNGVMPLLTTKRVFWRAVVEELLWFIAGCTDARVLQAKDVHIWDGNSTREFLDARGLGHHEVGDLGPVYGFQWRHFGADYHGFAADYTGQGVDQLQAVLRQLRTTPMDRRIVMSAWNPADISKMALPPCHMFCQFYVDRGEDGQQLLSCLMYQRSADMGLGVPFNIASYALLTHLVARVTGMCPHELVLVMGDAHVYKTHEDALRIQVERPPRPFPRLRIDDGIGQDIDAVRAEHITLFGYDPHPAIKMPMAV